MILQILADARQVMHRGNAVARQLPGIADVWAGRVQLPYYLTAPSAADPTAPLTKYWTAAGASPVPGIDPTSRKLTRFNPVPAVTSQQTVPLLLGVPNEGSGCTEPASGWQDAAQSDSSGWQPAPDPGTDDGGGWQDTSDSSGGGGWDDSNA